MIDIASLTENESYLNLAHRGFFWSIIAENSFVISG